MFHVVQVDSRARESLEPLGTKPKFWFRSEDGRRHLFKAEDRGTGEDWAEKLSCELCARLGLPHVHYELAVEIATGTPGVVCGSIAERPVELVLGNQVLLEQDPQYPATRKRSVREHTVEAVAEAVARFELPSAKWLSVLPAGIGSALDVFVGYVMLDAWIANQDRHHENWGALRTGTVLSLAPSYDHGASMARNLTDDERTDRLTTRDRGRTVPAFARRARSAFYATADATRTMTTMEAWYAFSSLSSNAPATWLECLAAVDNGQVERLVEAVPPHRISLVGREFVVKLLAENRRRLLEGDRT